MLRRLTDSEEDTNDNWLQAYMAGKYFDAMLRGAFLLAIGRVFLNPWSITQTFKYVNDSWNNVRNVLIA